MKTSLIIPLHESRGKKVRVLCLPHAGGTYNSFIPWYKLLEDICDLYSTNLPGKPGRLHEQPYQNMAKLINDLRKEKFFTDNTPLILLGHRVY